MVHIQYGPVIWTTDGPSVIVSYKIGMWSFSSASLLEAKRSQDNFILVSGPGIFIKEHWSFDIL